MKIFPEISKFILSRLNFSISRKLNDQRVRIPNLNGMKVGVKNEQWMSGVLAKLLPLSKQGCFVDVGANLGQTLIKLKTLSENFKYIGFEPNPSCVFYLQELISANRFKNCTLLPCGLFSKDSILELELFGNDDADPLGSVISGFRKDKTVTKRKFVPLITYETFKRSCRPLELSLVKVDAEGAELEVLQTIQNDIAEQRPFLLMEILPVYDSKNEFRLKRQIEIECILKEIDFQLFRITKKDNHFLAFDKIETFGIHSNISDCDYFACPTEAIDRISP
jgi:FkbM family methyltransferase